MNKSNLAEVLESFHNGELEGCSEVLSLVREGAKTGTIPAEKLEDEISKLLLSDEEKASLYASIQSLEIPITDTQESKQDKREDTSELSDDITSNYLRTIGNIPIMSHEEIVDNVKLVRAGEDAARQLKQDDPKDTQALEKTVKAGLRARDRIVEGNLRLVVSIAKRFAKSAKSMQLMDLIQEGNIGLLKAIERYDYTLGYKFSTYATWWVIQAVSRSMAEQDAQIRQPVHMRESVVKMNRALEAFHNVGISTPSNLDIAIHMEGCLEKWDKLSEKGKAARIARVRNCMTVPRASVSLDAPVGGQYSEDADATLADFIPSTDMQNDPALAVEQADLMEQAERTLSMLRQKEAVVIRLRFGLEDGTCYTLEEVGRELGLTRERIRQVERGALRKMRNSPAMRKCLADFAGEDMPIRKQSESQQFDAEAFLRLQSSRRKSSTRIR